MVFGVTWVLNQTVIRDAKSSGGIVGLTRKESALLRWIITRQSLGEYATATHSRSGIHPSEASGHEQTQPSAMKRDEQDVQQIVKHEKGNMTHPFNCNEHPDGHLVNISSGVVATKDIQKSLTSVIEVGTTQMEQYINESLSVDGQKSMFEAIKKTNLKNFHKLQKEDPYSDHG